MSIRYSVIEIFTSEETRCHGVPIAKAVIQFVSHLGIAARCMVIRGIGGCYESGEIASSTIEILSYNMPLKIEIVLPSSELDRVLPSLEEMIDDGIILVEEREAWIHKTHSRLIPRHLKVKDAMTHHPKFVSVDAPLRAVVSCMIQGGFNGIPAIDGENRPVGMITQGDLITRGELPVRLGLLAEFSQDRLGDLFAQSPLKTAREVMSSPAVTVQEDIDLTKAVDIMLQRKLKRLPVIDPSGQLSGMLARLDVFRTVMNRTPDWRALSEQHVAVQNIRFVREIMERDMDTVFPDTPIEEIVKTIDSHNHHRVAVVDAQRKLKGIISDRDLIALFSSHRANLWSLILSRVPLLKSSRFYDEIVKTSNARTAADVMKRELITTTEDTPIQEAIKQMTENHLKRLPVVDEEGLFRGSISRDSLLRAGIDSEETSRS